MYVIYKSDIHVPSPSRANEFREKTSLFNQRELSSNASPSRAYAGYSSQLPKALSPEASASCAYADGRETSRELHVRSRHLIDRAYAENSKGFLQSTVT